MTQLEPLQSLFKNRVFVIPDYQRGYAWEADQRQDLLNDLEDLAEVSAGKAHYTGTVVFHRGNHDSVFLSGTKYDVVDIVDGQQRITTIAVLLSVIVKVLQGLAEEEYTETAAVLRGEYLERKSTQQNLVRLRLNGNADAFFRDFILGDDSAPDPTIPAHKNLLDAKREFSDYITSRLEPLESAEEKGRFLYDLISRMTSRLGFVVYEVEDEAEVGVMFEVMNARGRELTDIEKVKNYLLYIGSRVSENKSALEALSKDVNETWMKILEAITAAGPSGNEDQFLRYHWGIYPGAGWYDESRARTSNIHGAVKKTLNLRVKTKNEIYQAVVQYLSSLRSLAVSYRDVVNPRFNLAFSLLTDGKDIVIDRAIRLQRAGRTATVLPILMAAHNRFGNNPAALGELFRLSEVFAFRLAAAGKRANAGDTYAYGIAAEVMNGTLTAEQTCDKVKGLINYYCTEFQLKATLLDPTMDFYRWTPLKYFLFEYERHLAEKAGQKFAIDWALFYRKNKEDSIEHILPQGDATTGITYWGSRFTAEQQTAYRNRLGNLCVTDWNSSYSNKPFPEKLGSPSDGPEKKTYRNSSWRMERELVHYPDWTPAAIEQRQSVLAGFALERWSI